MDEISTQICDAFGSSTQVDRDKAYGCINRAIGIIARKGRWPFFRVEDATFDTVANQETYKLPANVRLPEFIHMRNPAYKLKMVDLRIIRKLYPNNTELTGTPRFWRVNTFDKNSQRYTVSFFPIPDGVITMYVDSDFFPAGLTDKEDDVRSSGIPTEMIETVINLAIALMYEKYDNEMYAGKMQAALQMLDDDYYRLGNHPDEDLLAREFSGKEYLNADDPRLPTTYS